MNSRVTSSPLNSQSSKSRGKQAWNSCVGYQNYFNVVQTEDWKEGHHFNRQSTGIQPGRWDSEDSQESSQEGEILTTILIKTIARIFKKQSGFPFFSFGEILSPICWTQLCYRIGSKKWYFVLKFHVTDLLSKSFQIAHPFHHNNLDHRP